MSDRTQSDLLFLRLQRALVGRYSLERELGSGGMGVVFLARDVRLDRPVALKLLRPEIAEHAEFRARFLKEARTAAGLSHPNIVPIHAVEEADDLVFFVMGFIDGETLGERVRRQGPLSSDENSRVLREIAWALSYAHARGITHRDIKADNILVERNSGRALLADFGIAHASGEAEGAQLVGTTTYLAPEVIEGRPPTGRSDLYALGVVGFFAAAGRLPFDGLTNAEIMARHLAQPTPLVAESAPDISARLARAIDKCLAKNPAERFESAEAFAAALEHQTAAVQAQPVLITQWLRRWEGVAPIYAMAMPVLGMLYLLNEMPLAMGGYYGSNLVQYIYDSAKVVLGIALAVHFVLNVRQLRRVLAAGYRREDLIVALASERRRDPDLDRRRVLPPLTARVIRDCAYISLGVMALAALAIRVIVGMIDDETVAKYLYWNLMQFLMTFRLVTYITVGVGVVYPGRYTRRGNWWQRIQESFWRSPLGAGTVKLLSIGLKPRIAEETVHRPTEIALSLAADQLYAALPAALQSTLGDVPGLIKTLEQQATALRVSIDELEASGISVTDTGDADRKALAELRTTLESRHAEVIGALERVRLQLIRLAAGANELPEITEVLDAARRLEHDLGRSVAGQAAIRKLLGRRKNTSGLSPTPSPV